MKALRNDVSKHCVHASHKTTQHSALKYGQKAFQQKPSELKSHNSLRQLEQLFLTVYLEGEGVYVKCDSQICDSLFGYLLKLQQGLSVYINISAYPCHLQ